MTACSLVRRLFNVTLITVALGALTGCFKTYEWHQKLTVVIETPDSVKTASSVVKVTKSNNTSGFVLPDGGSAGSKFRGEAVVLEVLPGRYLFALLEGSNSIAQKTFPLSESSRREHELWVTAIQNTTGIHNLPREHYPLLVTFTDINDPTSVQRVDPEDLAASFGPGVSLQAITLEITDEPVTEGRVELVLGNWLSRIWPNRLDGDRYGYANAEKQLANSLSSNSFSTEIKK